MLTGSHLTFCQGHCGAQLERNFYLQIWFRMVLVLKMYIGKEEYFILKLSMFFLLWKCSRCIKKSDPANDNNQIARKKEEETPPLTEFVCFKCKHILLTSCRKHAALDMPQRVGVGPPSGYRRRGSVCQLKTWTLYFHLIYIFYHQQGYKLLISMQATCVVTAIITYLNFDSFPVWRFISLICRVPCQNVFFPTLPFLSLYFFLLARSRLEIVVNGHISYSFSE